MSKGRPLAYPDLQQAFNDSLTSLFGGSTISFKQFAHAVENMDVPEEQKKFAMRNQQNLVKHAIEAKRVEYLGRATGYKII